MSLAENVQEFQIEKAFQVLSIQEEEVVAVVAFIDPNASVCEFGSKGRRQNGVFRRGVKEFMPDSDADLMIFFSETAFQFGHFSLKCRLKQELNKRRAGLQVDEIVFDPKSLADLAFWAKILYRGESLSLYRNGRFSFPWREKGFIPDLPAIVGTIGEW